MKWNSCRITKFSGFVLQVGGRSVVCKEVEQHVIVLEEDQKFLKLLEILGHYYNQGSTIIFVDKQENADTLLKDLMKASYSCMALHGGIDQYDRDSNIVDFKNGKIKILVSDSDISYVIACYVSCGYENRSLVEKNWLMIVKSFVELSSRGPKGKTSTR